MIASATTPDERVKYAVHLHRQNTDALGFIPEPRLHEYARRGQLLIREENGDPCGYAVIGCGHPILRVYQLCVQDDARRREHATNLIKRLVRYGSQGGYEAIIARCGSDLPSNEFWEAAGFELTAVEPGGERRGRDIKVWTLRLPEPLLQEAS